MKFEYARDLMVECIWLRATYHDGFVYTKMISEEAFNFAKQIIIKNFKHEANEKWVNKFSIYI